MASRKVDPTDYNIRKGYYGEEEPDYHRSSNGNHQERRRGLPRADQGRRTNKKKEDCSEFLNIFKQPQKKESRQDITFKDSSQNKAPKREIQIYRSKYIDQKKRLDEKIDRYQRRHPQNQKPQQRRSQDQPIQSQQESWSIDNKLEDKLEKSTTETNPNNEILSDLKEEDFPKMPKQQIYKEETIYIPEKIQNQTGRGNRKHPSANLKKSEAMPLKESSSESQSQSKVKEINLLNTWSILHDTESKQQLGQLKDLIQQEQPVEPLKQEQPNKRMISKEELQKKIQSLAEAKQRRITVTVQADENILQFRVKEIQLKKLGVSACIDSNSQITLKKYQDFDPLILEQYIRIKETGNFFPNIPRPPSEHFHKAVEGMDESFSNDIPKTNFQLCSLKQEQNQMALQIVKVMVKCMQCQTKNVVAVPASHTEICCSCNKCSSRIIGKLKVDEE